MSNPRAWRAKTRTTKPNARQKRAGLYLDVMTKCQGCWSEPSEHAHHMLHKSFTCRTSWYAMRAFCGPCHVEWHRPVGITFARNGGELSLRLDSHRRLECGVSSQRIVGDWKAMKMCRVPGYILGKQHVRMVFSPRWGV